MQLYQLIYVASLAILTHSDFVSCLYGHTGFAYWPVLVHHLQIYLWVEKLYYHAVAHDFTKFSLKSCSLSLTFIIRIEVQKQLCGTSAAAAYKEN